MTQKTKQKLAAELLELKYAAWRRGDLSFLLLDHQIEFDRQISGIRSRKIFVNCSRRWGKSVYCVVKAFEHCLQNPNAQVMYAAPTGKQVKKIIRPHIAMILETCPPELKPRYSTEDGAWLFPNGAALHIAGCDNGNHESLRGAYTTLGIVDEAGFIDDVAYVVNSILFPQTMTCNGKLLVISTPPKSPSHPFRGMCVTAMELNAYVHRDIYSASHVTPALIKEYMQESGGEKSTTWKREYLGMFVTDADSAILPEFQEMMPTIVEAFEPHQWIDRYVSADLGFVDLTAVVFAYWHFESAKLYVVDELIFKKKDSATIANAIKAKELELWGENRPLMRLADCDPIIRADFAATHRLGFIASRRDDLEAQVNGLRLLITEDKLRIHPRCKVTIEHLANGVWDTTGLKFARSGEHGHFDALAAMMYLTRNVNRKRNPKPQYTNGESSATHHMPRQKPNLSGASRAFLPQRRRF